MSVELTSGDPLLVFDSELKVVWLNEAALELVDCSPEEAVGKTCWEVLGASDTEGNVVCHAGCASARLAAEGWPIPCRELVINRGGRPRRVFASTIVFKNGREPLFLHVLHRRRGQTARSAPRLTPRQLEVLTLLDAGLPPKVIATRLGLKVITVRNHIRAIRMALSAHSQLEAIANARRAGLLDS